MAYQVNFYDPEGRLQRADVRNWVADIKSRLAYSTESSSSSRLCVLSKEILEVLSYNAINSLRFNEDSQFLSAEALPPVPFDFTMALESATLRLANDFLTVSDLDILTHRVLKAPADIFSDMRLHRSKAIESAA